MEELQLEEQQKTSQQAQDRIPYDPNAVDRFPEGYTPVGGVSYNTPVEQVDLSKIPAVEATAEVGSLNYSPDFYYGSLSDYLPVSQYVPSEVTGNTEISFNFPLGSNNVIPNSISDIYFSPTDNISIPTDPGKQEEPVDPVPPMDPPVDPPEEPEDPEDPDPEDPEDPEDPPPPPPDPEDPDPEDPEDPDPEDPDPEDPEDPEDPDPEDPEDPDPEDPEDPGKGNNGFGNGDQDAPGNSGSNNNAENDQTPGEQGNSHQNNNDNGGSGGNHGGQNNGWGNGDQDAPGNSGSHNNAENDQTPNGHTADLINQFLIENPTSNDHQFSHDWHQDDDNFLDYSDEIPIEMMNHVDLGYVDHLDHSHDIGYHHPE